MIRLEEELKAYKPVLEFHEVEREIEKEDWMKDILDKLIELQHKETR